MGGGGQLVGQVAQVILDLTEGLVFGEVHQPLGHAAEGLLGVGLEAVQQFLDACLAVSGGRGCVRRECVHEGPILARSQPSDTNFPPADQLNAAA